MVLPLATFDLHFDRPVNVQQGSKLTSAYVPRASSDLLNNLSETFFVLFSWLYLAPSSAILASLSFYVSISIMYNIMYIPVNNNKH